MNAPDRATSVDVSIRLQPTVRGGQVHVEGVAEIGGTGHEFSGWIGLLDVLERAAEAGVGVGVEVSR